MDGNPDMTMHLVYAELDDNRTIETLCGLRFEPEPETPDRPACDRCKVIVRREIHEAKLHIDEGNSFIRDMHKALRELDDRPARTAGQPTAG